jgi:hypothetical protein
LKNDTNDPARIVGQAAGNRVDVNELFRQRFEGLLSVNAGA